MPSSATTQSPNKAAAFWDSVYKVTKNADEADRQTFKKFGPPPDDPTFVPPMEGVVGGASSLQLPPRKPGMGLMAANANFPLPDGSQLPTSGTGTMPVGQALGAAAGQFANTMGWGVPNALGMTDPAAQEALHASDPALSFLAKAGGAIVSGMGLGRAGAKTAEALVRTTGMSAKTANLLASMGLGGGTGAISGAAAADPGSRNEGAAIGGAIGAGVPLALNMAASGIKGLIGYVSKAHRQEVTDAFLLDRLDSEDMTVQGVIDRVTMLDDIATPPANLAEAMGPAGTRAVKMVGTVSPQAQGQALRTSRELEDAVQPLIDRAKAVKIAVKDMGLNAKDAKQHVDMLMQVVDQRRALAKELFDLSKRDPKAAQDIMAHFATGRLFGRTIGKIGSLLANHLGGQMASQQADDILSQLLETQPMDFLGQVQGRMKDFAGQQTASSVVRGLLGGMTGRKAAKTLTGSPGTTYTKE